MKTHLLLLSILSLSAAPLFGQILFNGSYTQNFNSLPTSATNVTGSSGGSPAWTNDVTLDGWFAGSSSTWVDGFAISNGGLSPTLAVNGTNGVGSFGTSSATDRALAPVRRNGGVSYVAIQLTNDTGSTLTELTLSFTGEQWRENALAAQLDFAYSVDPLATINSGTYSNFDALDFISPKTTNANTVLDGNDPANRTALSQTITGLSIANGDEIWLRWGFAGNNAVNLAVDDLSITTVPEPSAWTLLAGSLTTLLIFRRSRSIS